MSGPRSGLRAAVVGGGISGLACARRLSRGGLEARVFERREAPGGRLREHRGGGLSFDLGAGYFTVRDPRFEEQTERWAAAGVCRPWEGSFAVLREGRVEEERDPPRRHVGVPSMQALARELAVEAVVLTGKEVDRLEPSGSAGRRWRLWAGAEDLGAHDLVVAAVPAPRAAVLLRQACRPLASRCARLEARPCWAVAAAFSGELGFEFDAAFVRDSPLSWVGRNSGKPGRDDPADAWVLHAGPGWSASHRDEAAGRVREALLAAFFRATGTRSVPPFYAHAHLWPHARAREPLERGSLYDPDAGVAACGDWASGNRVEGAFLSGFDLAGRILSSVGG